RRSCIGGVTDREGRRGAHGHACSILTQILPGCRFHARRRAPSCRPCRGCLPLKEHLTQSGARYPGMREAGTGGCSASVRPSGGKTRSLGTSCRASISRLTTETLAFHAKG